MMPERESPGTASPQPANPVEVEVDVFGSQVHVTSLDGVGSVSYELMEVRTCKAGARRVEFNLVRVEPWAAWVGGPGNPVEVERDQLAPQVHDPSFLGVEIVTADLPETETGRFGGGRVAFDLVEVGGRAGQGVSSGSSQSPTR